MNECKTMDKITGENYLEKIHKEIILTSHHYQFPESLLAKVNDEYLEYLDNKHGNSFYYQWLALLVKILKPKLVLELGNSYGLSTLMMFSELSDEAKLISCDLVKQLDFVPSHVFNDPRLKFYFGNDLNLSIFGDDLPIGIDMLFIDTSHTFNQISAEWKIYKHLCNPMAIVVLDDIRMNDMFDFWKSLPYPKLELTKECHASGFGFFLFTEQNLPDPLNVYRTALQNALEQSGFIQDKQMKKNACISSICKKVASKLLFYNKK